MHVTEEGQVTIPKRIRQAAGVAPGSEVAFSLDGDKIVITPVGTSVKGDRRAKLRAVAAHVRKSLNPEFKQLGADEIMALPGRAARRVGRPAYRHALGLRLADGRRRCSLPPARRLEAAADARLLHRRSCGGVELRHAHARPAPVHELLARLSLVAP
jgi:antitoxin PrlF